MVKINDLILFEDWISRQSGLVAELMANRIALRMLPFWREMARFNNRTVHASFHIWRLLYIDWAYFAVTVENPKLLLSKREAENNYIKHAPRTNYAALLKVNNHQDRVKHLSSFLRVFIKTSSEIVSSDDPAEKMWEAISFDASAIDSGRSFSFIATRSIWPLGVPHWANEAWQKFSQKMVEPDLLDSNTHWKVWTNWYQQRVAGSRVDEELESKKAVTPEPVWYKGAKELNTALLRTEELHREKLQNDRRQLSLLALLSTKEIRAAIADFRYDQLSNLMRMVPFADDAAKLDDSDSIKHRKDMLSELSDGIRELADDINSANKNIPRPLINALERYALEISRDFDEVRAGRLWDLGSVIHTASLDDDIRFALGDLLHKSLEILSNKHLDLMRDYFASTLARQRNVDEIEPIEGASADQVLAHLKSSTKELRTQSWGALPPPDDEIPAILSDQVEEIEALLNAATSTDDEKVRRQRLDAFWRKAKTAAVTLVRFSVTAMKAIGATAGSLSAFQSLFPAQYAKALELLVSLFKNIPWFS
jgi:hypothetical protein